MSDRACEWIRSYAGVLALGIVLGLAALVSQVRFLDSNAWWIINQYEPPLIQKGRFFLNPTVRNVLFKPEVLRPTGFFLSMKVKLIDEAALQIRFLQQEKEVSLTLADNGTDILSGRWLTVTAVNRENRLTLAVDGRKKLEADLDPIWPLSLRLDKETIPLLIDDVVIRDDSGKIVFQDRFGRNLFDALGLLLCLLGGMAAAFLLHGAETLLAPPILRTLTPRKLRESFFTGWIALPLYGLAFGVFLPPASPLIWIAMVLVARVAASGNRRMWEETVFQGTGRLFAIAARAASLPAFAALLLLGLQQSAPGKMAQRDSALFLFLALGLCLLFLFSAALVNRKQLRFSGILLLLLVVGLFTVAESALRHSPLDTRLSPQRTGVNFRPDNALFFVPPDFFVAADGKGQGEPFVVTGLHFRSGVPQKPKPEGRFRIMVLGGSNVWGDGIANPKDVFPAQLESILKARHPGRDIEVINAGMKGYILFQLKLMLQLYALDYEPDLIVLYVNRNDSATQYGPYTLRELWESRADLPSLDSVTEQVKAPDPTFGERLRIVLRRSRLYSGLTRIIIGAREQQLAAVTRKLKITREVNPVEDYSKTLEEMIDLCQKRRIGIVLADEYMFWTQPPAPTDRAMLIKEKMRQIATKRGVSFLPVHDLLTEQHPDGSMMLKTDIVHLNKEGHREVAELIADFLESQSLLETR